MKHQAVVISVWVQFCAINRQQHRQHYIFFFNSFEETTKTSIDYLPITLAFPPSNNSDPGLHSGPSSPPPTTVCVFTFIASIIQHFLPSSTCVELCLYPRCIITDTGTVGYSTELGTINSLKRLPAVPSDIICTGSEDN